jgi:alpha-galactosidase
MATTNYLSWFALVEEDQASGLMGGLQWEGAWVLNFDRWSGRAIHVYGGVNKCSHVLEPGGTLESPHAFYGPYHGELDDGLHGMHQYLRNHVMPANPDERFPWVSYNGWFRYATGISEKVLKPELDIAEEIGVECFYLDAGWSEGMNPAWDGLGNWVEDRKKFPSGVASFSEEVHRRGLKFALWVEPERTNREFAKEERWLSKRDGYYVGIGEDAILCFGNPDVRAWCKEWLQRVLSEFNVDWLRWDLNAYNICNRPDHGHQAGDGDFTHVNGVYEVMGFLRQRFPKLVIENCASGGNRFGFGVMHYANITLNSDVPWPSYRARHQVIGCSYPFPSQYQLAAYVKTSHEPVNTPKEPVDENSSSTYLDYLFRSRMMGTFQISDSMVEWTPNIKRAAQKAILEFKKLRPILKGEVHHLLPQAVMMTPPMRPPDQWEALEYYHPGLDTAAIFCFRAQPPEIQRKLLVPGLRPDYQYRVTYEDAGKSFLAMGRVLAREGITVHLPEMNSSELIWIGPSA